MQTLKFKIEHKYNDLLIEYQKQYSIILRSAFKYFQKEDKDLKSLFSYKNDLAPLYVFICCMVFNVNKNEILTKIKDELE